MKKHDDRNHYSFGGSLMGIVIKRDGSREDFDRGKLISSLKSAGVDEDSAIEIAEGIDYDLADEEISSFEIRSWVEDEMKFYKPEALRKYSNM